MDLQTTWFVLFGVLIIGYAILDGFDLGVGVLHIFAKNGHERRIHMNAIGPVWDGNEVWLVTAGGALFAAFPVVYATVFSAFYLALVFLLFALIFRAVSMEFRGKVDSPLWRTVWDWAFALGSLLAAVLFGVAVGNIMRGLPLNENGTFTGTFFGLLHPYCVLIGVLNLALFTMQGASWMIVKTDGELQARMRAIASRLWMAVVVFYVVATVSSLFVAPFLFEGLLGRLVFWPVFLLLLASMVYFPVAARSQCGGIVFLCSSVMVGCMVALIGVSLYPYLVPSMTDLGNSLTIYNACSTNRTLKVMLAIALLGMPVVVAYTVVIYRVFWGKVVIGEESY